jgi:ATPase, P-type (transporting), HAD superfamily, subfamily IC/heavy metal translocating P-type ATPase
MAVDTLQSPVGPVGGITELSVTGMDCSNCARHVTESLQSVPGVHSAMVDLAAKSASVRWNPGATVQPESLVQAVTEAGYGASVVEGAKSKPDEGEKKLAGWEFTLWVGILGAVPLMLGEWVFHVMDSPWYRWTAFFLAAIVQIFAGAQFYRGAWNQLKSGRSNMDTLVALGSTTAFTYSVWALLNGNGAHVYFMESASIITLISLGHWMESRVSVRASDALKKLLNLAPQTARRVSANGEESITPVAELRIGDLVALRPGDRVPTDGEVVEGDSAVDEAMLTGESTPADKSPGKLLYAGTVNLNGRLLMRITATGESTALSHIIAAVQRAQTSRANIQRLGDRVSSVFVPIVVAIALGAALWWGLAPESAANAHAAIAPYLWPAHPPAGKFAAAFIIASAVLIIACPCAMGLATPTAIMAGSNAAAQRGILIRDGVALEKAGDVTAVVFDKTGTLTVGKPRVVKTWKAARIMSLIIPPEELAAALSAHSTHPISQAIAQLSAERKNISDWTEVRGSGVEGNWNENGTIVNVKLGSLAWLRDSGVNLSEGEAFVREWSAQGATLVGLSVDSALVLLVAVKDTLKTGAADVVEKLRRQGLKIHLLTGDNRLTAESIAEQVGIDRTNVGAEVRPEQKADFVRGLQQRGERVAFVGDGINDAPALEQANLGIAVSRASDVAREAADIILLKSEIEAVPEALGLARATLRTIRQNLFWAFFYNAAGIPLAALGFMSPVLCAAAMGFSDMIVIGNALRLRRWKG